MDLSHESPARCALDLDLPFSPESAHAARERIRDCLGDRLDADTLADARLVVSELVGNAIRHARPLEDGTVRVAWTRDADGLVISVTDGGAPSSPARRDVSATDIAGRGLAIVEALCQRWWVEQTRHQTSVHAALALT